MTPIVRYYYEVKIYSVGVWKALVFVPQERLADLVLKFTPLEFESYSISVFFVIIAR